MLVAMQITRRELAAALVAAAPAPADPQAASGDLLQAARDRLKSNVQALSGIEVPMDTEPAFQFKP
jgi:hypothetical protein